jgi:hypothetical protein
VFGDLVLKSKYSFVHDNLLEGSEVTKDKSPFKGYDNALKLNEDRNGFSIEEREVMNQKANYRVIDILLFSMGELTEVDRPKICTSYKDGNKDATLFVVPKNTKIFDYNQDNDEKDERTPK